MYARNEYDAMEIRSRGCVGKGMCGSESGLVTAPERAGAVTPPTVKTDKCSRNSRLVNEAILCIYPARKLAEWSSISSCTRRFAPSRFTWPAISKTCTEIGREEAYRRAVGNFCGASTPYLICCS